MIYVMDAPPVTINNNAAVTTTPWPDPPVRAEGEEQADFHSRRKAWACQTALHYFALTGVEPTNEQLRWMSERVVARV
jgi:hypothetical protein